MVTRQDNERTQGVFIGAVPQEMERVPFESQIPGQHHQRR